MVNKQRKGHLSVNFLQKFSINKQKNGTKSVPLKDAMRNPQKRGKKRDVWSPLYYAKYII